MRRALIIDAIRTPIGRYGGALKACRPDDLAALVLKSIIERTKIDPALIDDVYMGAANQAGEGNRNVARMAVLLAGLPETIPGCTVNRLCASGLEAVNIASRMIEAGLGDVFLAGGVESMTRAPLVMLKPDSAFARGNPEVFDSTIGWRFTNARLAKRYHPFSMGETAENVARKYGVSRSDQDRFALMSQQRTKAAQMAGRFDEEIIPVEVAQPKGSSILVKLDEHPRPETTLDDLTKLPPAFAKDGTVTAGNSSGINDGASVVLLVADQAARRLDLRPLALVGPSATAGVDPSCMGIGPVPATRKTLERGKLGIDDIDLIELNEAFAAQAIACIRELGLDESRVNPNGGAIALGHPLGCTGARLVTTLVHEMRRRAARRGLATLCVGVGQGVATLIEGV